MADEYFDPEIETRPWPEFSPGNGPMLPGLPDPAVGGAVFRERLAGLDRLGRTHPRFVGGPFHDQGRPAGRPSDDAPEQPLETAAVPMADVVQVLASSGTTGTPVFFGWTEPTAGVAAQHRHDVLHRRSPGESGSR
jgi:hypothetical protein